MADRPESLIERSRRAHAQAPTPKPEPETPEERDRRAVAQFDALARMIALDLPPADARLTASRGEDES